MYQKSLTEGDVGSAYKEKTRVFAKKWGQKQDENSTDGIRCAARFIRGGEGEEIRKTVTAKKRNPFLGACFFGLTVIQWHAYRRKKEAT